MRSRAENITVKLILKAAGVICMAGYENWNYKVYRSRRFFIDVEQKLFRKVTIFCHLFFIPWLLFRETNFVSLYQWNSSTILSKFHVIYFVFFFSEKQISFFFQRNKFRFLIPMKFKLTILSNSFKEMTKIRSRALKNVVKNGMNGRNIQWYFECIKCNRSKHVVPKSDMIIQIFMSTKFIFVYSIKTT